MPRRDSLGADRFWGCLRKVAYTKLRSAYLARERMQQQHGGQYIVYRCKFSNDHWHVGHGMEDDL